MEKVIKRFIKYIKIDTQSNVESKVSPSTQGQLKFAEILISELKDLGLKGVSLDKNGYIMATLPSNIDKKVPVIGLIAHLDTSPDFSSKNVNPQFVENYNGTDIVLNKVKNIILSPVEFPELKQYVGQTLITTDGTTLLGADDKAGVAEIMSALEDIVKNKKIKHGEIKVAFTPDEEIGRGTDHFDVKKFGADYAYTIDGQEVGQLEYENFNAANVKMSIFGKNIHPGYAKNKMKNALLIAHEFQSLLPKRERPEFTEGQEGFYHLNNINGSVEKVDLYYIIRDHDRKKFENKKVFFRKRIEKINKKYGDGTINAEINDMYYNMKEKIEPVMHIVEIAKEAMTLCGITPVISQIRGGTDGARLSYMGLPCPNIFSGGRNPHGKFEYIPVESMVKAVEVIVKITELYAEIY